MLDTGLHRQTLTDFLLGRVCDCDKSKGAWFPKQVYSEHSSGVYAMLITKTVDARGKQCPMPILMAKRAMADCGQGDVIEVLATDPTAPNDFETFARLEGHNMSWEARDEMIVILLLLGIATGG